MLWIGLWAKVVLKSPKNLLCEISKFTKVHIYFLKISNPCVGISTFWPFLLQLTSLFCLMVCCISVSWPKKVQEGVGMHSSSLKCEEHPCSQASATEGTNLSWPLGDSRTIPRAWLTNVNVYNYHVENQSRHYILMENTPWEHVAGPVCADFYRFPLTWHKAKWVLWESHLTVYFLQLAFDCTQGGVWESMWRPGLSVGEQLPLVWLREEENRGLKPNLRNAACPDKKTGLPLKTTWAIYLE